MADLLTSDLPSLTEGDPLVAMDRIHEALMNRARDTIAWYDRHRDQQRRWARGLRMLSILLGSAATLLPMGVSMIHAYSPTMRADALLPASSILALLAATCVLLDKFFGCSSSWMRFTTAYLELRSRAESFDFAWRAERLKLRPHADGAAAPLEVVLAAYTLHQQFLDAINELVRNETRDWLLEFKGALAELERRVEEQRQSLPVPERGALRLQLEGDPGAGPWHLRLDNGDWIEQRGAVATVQRLAPGIHSLELRFARKDGAETVLRDVIKIEPNQIQEKLVKVPG